MVTKPKIAARKENGSVRTTSRRKRLSVAWRFELADEFRHHAQSNNANGRKTTWVLESRASKKATSAALYPVPQPRTRWSSASKKHRAEVKKKNIERRFFSSEIQATDSAWIG